MIPGVTFDTGALIALERRSARMKGVLAAIYERHLPITIPVPVIMEWYRGQRDARRILAVAKQVEPLSQQLAEIAGRALARTGGSNVVDAAVMASAAQRGDCVFTADLPDLSIFKDVFPVVRLFGC